ncbi:MAG: glycosyl hydrolase family 18 protein [Clostridia bacterium]
MKKISITAMILIYTVVSIFAVFIGIEKIREKYRAEDEIIAFYESGRTNLVIGDMLVKGYDQPLVSGGEILLPFDLVKDLIDPTVYKEPDGSVVTVTSDDKVIRMRDGEVEAYVNMEQVRLDMTARYINRVLYIPIMVFREIFGIEAAYLEEHDVVIIDFLKNYEHVGFVSPSVYQKTENNAGNPVGKARVMPESVAIRSGMSIKFPVYREIGSEGEEVDVYEIDGEWARIRTSEGIIGYIESRFLRSSVSYEGIVVDLIRRTPGEIEDIVLAWQYIYKTTPPVEDFMEYPQINVYSPTWFTVIASDGTMESRADYTYVNKVHEIGARIWPLLNNTFNDIEMTSAVLNNPEARDNMIRQVLAYSQLYGFDGINMDFENIYLKDRDAYTQLIREMMPYARKMGIKISVDVGIPGGSDTYSLCYDHKRLSENADYIMVMTYDQFWASSPIAGSQAQLPWVEEMIERTLKYVHPEKLVMGIPFYTRIWRELDGTVRNINTVGIDRAKKIVGEKNAVMEWDDASGQYYVYYEEEGAAYRMWLEDPRSIYLKAGLAVKYGLRGVAVWQLPLGNEDAWESIGKALSERLVEQ